MLKVNDNQYLTCKPRSNLDYITYLNITIKIQPLFSQVLGMRITFISSHRLMAYDYFLKQPKFMCEIQFNQLLDKNPQLINSLDT